MEMSNYKTVPIEPTQEMLLAGTEGDVEQFGDHARFVYRAMVSAAPVVKESLTPEQEREAFEAWMASPPYENDAERYADHESWPGNYKHYPMQLAWCAWQARAALAKEAA